jgi:chromate transporter
MQWLDPETFRRGVVLSQSLPGATAMQVAAYVGLQKRGIPGAFCAFTGFGLPAFVFMVLLSHFYAAGKELPWVQPLFRGLQVIVVALMANATYTFGREALGRRTSIFIAAASAAFIGLGVSPFFVILGAACAGMAVRDPPDQSAPAVRGVSAPPASHILILLLLAAGGMALLFLLRPDLFRLGLLMMKIDLFAFGGGYASVPLMFRELVTVRGWIDGKTFMDGIALGQITPGPIVITATFAGYLLHGLAGAVAATVGIFTPSFILVTAGSGLFNRLLSAAWFAGAVKAIFASFVGLLLAVTITFAWAVPWDLSRIFIVAAGLGALLKGVDILYVVLAGTALSFLLLH